jgi:DNA-binding transcriptional MerR regulator
MTYSVQKLAKLSGVSIRTLHYYDEVGLLKPARYGANGYRYYEEEQLLLLQQILFYRTLGLELKKIQEIVKKGDFDKLAALHSHRKVLVNDLDKTRELIQTIDNTIKHLQGQKKMKDKQFFEGLNSPKQKEYEKYLIEKGKHTAEELEEGRKRLSKWSKEEWEETQKVWNQLLNDYVEAIKKKAPPDSPEAEALVLRHFKYLNRFGIEIEKEKIVENANFYLGHPDWKKVFDGHHPQLLEYMLAAMEAYANKE